MSRHSLVFLSISRITSSAGSPRSLAPLTGGLATAAAIIAFTVAIRLLLLPLSYFAVRGSVRGEGARARLQPRIAELQRRHAQDPQRLQEELGALYRAEGSGMFGGFLPLLHPAAVLQRDVPPVPGPLGGRRAEHAAHAQPARRAAGQSLAGRRGAAQRAGSGVRGAVRAAGRGRGPGGPGHPPRRPRGSAGPSHPGAGKGAGRVRNARLATPVSATRAPATRASATPVSAARAPATPASVPGGRAVSFVTWVIPFASLVTAAIVPLAAGLYLLTTTAWTLAERTVLRRRFISATGPQSAGAPPR